VGRGKPCSLLDGDLPSCGVELPKWVSQRIVKIRSFILMKPRAAKSQSFVIWSSVCWHKELVVLVVLGMEKLGLALDLR
jgi:hypothetical protein